MSMPSLLAGGQQLAEIPVTARAGPEFGDQVGIGAQHTADHDAHRSTLLLVVEYGVELRVAENAPFELTRETTRPSVVSIHSCGL
jgi:hypothetical protein